MKKNIKKKKFSNLISKDYSLEEISNKCKLLIESNFIFENKNKERYQESKDFYDKFHFHFEECWNLDITIAAFILPRLIYFRDIYTGTPGDFFEYTEDFQILNERQGNKEWNTTLDLMIEAFYRICFVDDLSLDEKNRGINNVYIEKGLKLFAQYFQSLWD